MIPSVGRKVTPEPVQGGIRRVKELAAEGDTFWTDQFNNPDNPAGHRADGARSAGRARRPARRVSSSASESAAASPETPRSSNEQFRASAARPSSPPRRALSRDRGRTAVIGSKGSASAGSPRSRAWTSRTPSSPCAMRTPSRPPAGWRARRGTSWHHVRRDRLGGPGAGARLGPGPAGCDRDRRFRAQVSPRRSVRYEVRR